MIEEKKKGNIIKMILFIILAIKLVIVGAYIYSKVYELEFTKALFEFADNYLCVVGITIIVYILFKKSKKI